MGSIRKAEETHNSNPPVVTGICNPNKSQVRHQHSLKLGSKLKYLKKDQLLLLQNIEFGYSKST